MGGDWKKAMFSPVISLVRKAGTLKVWTVLRFLTAGLSIACSRLCAHIRLPSRAPLRHWGPGRCCVRAKLWGLELWGSLAPERGRRIWVC